MLEEALRAAWAVGAGIVAPGAFVVHAADLGRGPLERAVLAVAFGFLLLGGVTLVATSTGLAGAMPVWGALASNTASLRLGPLALMRLSAACRSATCARSCTTSVCSSR